MANMVASRPVTRVPYALRVSGEQFRYDSNIIITLLLDRDGSGEPDDAATDDDHVLASICGRHGMIFLEDDHIKLDIRCRKLPLSSFCRMELDKGRCILELATPLVILLCILRVTYSTPTHCPRELNSQSRTAPNLKRHIPKVRTRRILLTGCKDDWARAVIDSNHSQESCAIFIPCSMTRNWRLSVRNTLYSVPLQLDHRDVGYSEAHHRPSLPERH